MNPIIFFALLSIAPIASCMDAASKILENSSRTKAPSIVILLVQKCADLSNSGHHLIPPERQHYLVELQKLRATLVALEKTPPAIVVQAKEYLEKVAMMLSKEGITAQEIAAIQNALVIAIRQAVPEKKNSSGQQSSEKSRSSAPPAVPPKPATFKRTAQKSVPAKSVVTGAPFVAAPTYGSSGTSIPSDRMSSMSSTEQTFAGSGIGMQAAAFNSSSQGSSQPQSFTSTASSGVASPQQAVNPSSATTDRTGVYSSTVANPTERAPVEMSTGGTQTNSASVSGSNYVSGGNYSVNTSMSAATASDAPTGGPSFSYSVYPHQNQPFGGTATSQSSTYFSGSTSATSTNNGLPNSAYVSTQGLNSSLTAGAPTVISQTVPSHIDSNSGPNSAYIISPGAEYAAQHGATFITQQVGVDAPGLAPNSAYYISPGKAAVYQQTEVRPDANAQIPATVDGATPVLIFPGPRQPQSEKTNQQDQPIAPSFQSSNTSSPPSQTPSVNSSELLIDPSKVNDNASVFGLSQETSGKDLSDYGRQESYFSASSLDGYQSQDPYAMKQDSYTNPYSQTDSNRFPSEGSLSNATSYSGTPSSPYSDYGTMYPPGSMGQNSNPLTSLNSMMPMADIAQMMDDNGGTDPYSLTQDSYGADDGSAVMAALNKELAFIDANRDNPQALMGSLHTYQGDLSVATGGEYDAQLADVFSEATQAYQSSLGGYGHHGAGGGDGGGGGGMDDGFGDDFGNNDGADGGNYGGNDDPYYADSANW